jgi:hypothetical protein
MPGKLILAIEWEISITGVRGLSPFLQGCSIDFLGIIPVTVLILNFPKQQTTMHAVFMAFSYLKQSQWLVWAQGDTTSWVVARL